MSTIAVVEGEKPKVLTVQPDLIWPALIERDQWVGWKLVLVTNSKGEAKWTKEPYRARKPDVRASTTAPHTWAPFRVAYDAYLCPKNGLDGIGFVFSPDDPYCGIDLDNCVDPDTGAVDAWALEYIRRLGSYTEKSPSGRGFKVFTFGSFLGGKKKSGFGPRGDGVVEMYSEGRFFTVTGHFRLNDEF